MRTTSDHQKIEEAKVLLKQAGAVWIVWTAEDIADMVTDSLHDKGLSFSVSEVMLLINITHLSCDDDDSSIWMAIDDAITTIAQNKLGE